MSRYARKVDANHGDIVEGLRKFGCLVHSTANVGQGFPDLFVGVRGRVALLEVKVGKAKLTEAEEKFHRTWFGYPVHVVRTLDEALTAVGVKEKP